MSGRRPGEGDRGRENEEREKDQPWTPVLLGPGPPLSHTTAVQACSRPQTLDQQLEAPGATKDGDRGRGGLTRVGAGGIEGDGAEGERGVVPQGYRVLGGERKSRSGRPREKGGVDGSGGSCAGGTSFPLTLVQRKAGVGRPGAEQFTAVLLPRGKESSSPVLSSRGSRSGGGYRLSPSPDPHPLG